MSAKKETKLAWHWLAVDPTTKKPILRDLTPLRVGRWLRHNGTPVICSRGLHASYKALDALQYAPGCYVTRVKVASVRAEHPDKFVCSERLPLWGYDATAVLRAFARRVALDVTHLWNPPEIVLRYLQTGDESIRDAAEAAARDAAWAARHAAWAAARAADGGDDGGRRAGGAARDAAEAAARAAAWAARDAAWAAAWAAAWDKYSAWLEEMLIAGRKK